VTAPALTALLVVLAAAVAAPILSDLISRWIAVPAVVLEIGLGIVIGPALGLIRVDDPLTLLSSFGLATLLFLAGLEVDVARLRGGPLRRGALGWILSLALGLVIGIALSPIDGPRSGLITGLAITTTALGTLLPILRDSGELETSFGSDVLANAAIGELGPILAMSLLLGSDRPVRTVVTLAVFAGTVAAASYIARRDRNRRLARLLETSLETSGQLAIRLVVLFLVFMVWVSAELGVDVLLGAFAAGMVFRSFSAGSGEREAELVDAKLQGVGFGFLIPVFFVVSGVRFDLQAITSDPALVIAAAAFLALFIAARGLPTMLLDRARPVRDRAAIALYAATELPLVVVITNVGVASGRLRSGVAAAMVTAAMLSVLVCPLLAARVRGRHTALEVEPVAAT
jgi:Kef-type K+ transport system membrane component KefB